MLPWSLLVISASLPQSQAVKRIALTPVNLLLPPVDSELCKECLDWFNQTLKTVKTITSL